MQTGIIDKSHFSSRTREVYLAVMSCIFGCGESAPGGRPAVSKTCVASSFGSQLSLGRACDKSHFWKFLRELGVWFSSESAVKFAVVRS